MPITADLALTATNSVIADLIKSLSASDVSAAGKQLGKLYESATSSFDPYLRATFERCIRVKTIVNQDEPVNLLSLYVNSRFSCGGKYFDDYKVIEEIRARKRIVISGMGGGGKTIFTKYLWLSLFENPMGRIPIYIELRKFNEIQVEDLLVYIFHSISSAHATASLEAFNKGLAQGLFTLIFDGFDEITPDRRATVEKQILALANSNPDCIFVVTSRPDERFGAWQTFSTFQVLPMNQAEVINLIKKLKFDRKLKDKFIARVKTDLFEKHKSFLSSPLLATIMLMTYRDFADIPEKVHLFYQKAFDTLYIRHDAMKETFKREMHSDLPEDTLKSVLGLLCLKSYYDNKFEFTKAEVLEYIETSLKMEALSAGTAPAAFLNDLTESLCLMQMDGSFYCFVHRSFQEFFAAQALSAGDIPDIGSVMLRLAKRLSDDVLRMLFDMKQTLVEEKFIIPHLRELVESVGLLSDDRFASEYLCLFDPQISFQRMGGGKWSISAYGEADSYAVLNFVRVVYSEHFKLTRKQMMEVDKKDSAAARAFAQRNAFLMSGSRRRPKIVCRAGALVWVDSEGALLSDDTAWIEETGLRDYLFEQAKRLEPLLNGIEARSEKKAKALQRLFAG
jgi:hypothetical protein